MYLHEKGTFPTLPCNNIIAVKQLVQQGKTTPERKTTRANRAFVVCLSLCSPAVPNMLRCLWA
jgi:hypothetical protein